MTIAYETTKDFIEYVVAGEDGWEGLRKDAPESARKAYQEYLDSKRKKDENGFEVRI